MTAAPLYKILKKNLLFGLMNNEGSFNKLKEVLISATIIHFQNFDKQFIIRTDIYKDCIEVFFIKTKRTT